MLSAEFAAVTQMEEERKKRHRELSALTTRKNLARDDLLKDAIERTRLLLKQRKIDYSVVALAHMALVKGARGAVQLDRTVVLFTGIVRGKPRQSFAVNRHGADTIGHKTKSMCSLDDLPAGPVHNTRPNEFPFGSTIMVRYTQDEALCHLCARLDEVATRVDTLASHLPQEALPEMVDACMGCAVRHEFKALPRKEGDEPAAKRKRPA